MTASITVPAGTVAAMVFTMLLTAVLPIGLMLWFKQRGGKWTAFAVGAAVFFLFALVLEQIGHAIILKSPIGPVIQGNIWLTGLYGGLMAGLFEETGRLAAFKFLLRRQTQPATALAYGAGHGGFEAFLITGVTMLNNLIVLGTLAGGRTLSPELYSAAESLLAVSATMFLWAGFERAVAVVLHIALSVLVFASVTRPEKRWLFPAAVLLHFLVDFVAVTANAHLPTAALELLVAAIAAAAALLAAGVYKKLCHFVEYA